MILFIILMIVMLVMAVLTLFALSAGGAAFLLIFGDLIVFALIIWFIIKILRKKG